MLLFIVVFTLWSFKIYLNSGFALLYQLQNKILDLAW
jgi:hypothetical protein